MYALQAGLGSPSCFNRPAVEQKLHDWGSPLGGSRQSNQKTRSSRQRSTLSSSRRKDWESNRLWPSGRLFSPKRSGGPEPQPSSVSHSGLSAAPCFAPASPRLG